MEEIHNKKLYKAIDEVMHYRWDPLGVSDAFQARDEYNTYSNHVYKLAMENADEKTITQYLYNTEEETMGIRPNKDRCAEIASIVVEWRDYLKSEKE